MHLLMTFPCVWYENHLSVAVDMNVTGVSLPGLPLMFPGIMGMLPGALHQGMPMCRIYMKSACAGCRKIRFEYEFKEEWLPAEVRQEEIQVRMGA